MKKHLLIFCAIALNTAVFAQFYDFSQSTATFSTLTNSTSLNNGVTWDDPEYVIPVDIDFELFGSSINSLTFNGLGGVLISNLGSMIIPFGADIIDRGTTEDYYGTSESNISYKLEGPVGSRILKVEWNNVGFYGDWDEDYYYTTTDYVNFQMWLYETSNIVEVRFGASLITDFTTDFEGETGPLIGFYSMFDYDYYYNYTVEGEVLTGNALAPTHTVFNDSLASMTGMPSNGTVYKFAPGAGSVSINENLMSQVSVYPNPARDIINIQFGDLVLNNTDILIINTIGQTVETVSSTKQIDISNYESGIYFLQVNTNKGVVTKKFVKQ